MSKKNKETQNSKVPLQLPSRESLAQFLDGYIRAVVAEELERVSGRDALDFKSLRLSRGFGSAAIFAANCGVSSSMISMIERGLIMNPGSRDSSLFAKLACGLGVGVNEVGEAIAHSVALGRGKKRISL